MERDVLGEIFNHIESAVSAGNVKESLSICLLASAGSGKTYALTGLYLKLLSQGVDFSRILAVTFTNKAANEMKGRILERLSVSKTDRDLLGRILFDYSRFSVKTIDSFMNALRFSFAGEIGISPMAQVKVSFKEDLDRILYRVLEKAKDSEPLGRAVDEFIKMFVSLPGVYKHWDPTQDLKEFFSTFLTQEANFSVNLVCPDVDRHALAENVMARKKAFLREFKKCNARLSQNGARALERLTEENLFKNPKQAFSSALFGVDSGGMLARLKRLLKSATQEQLSILEDLWRRLNNAIARYVLGVSIGMARPFAILYDEFKKELESYQFQNDILYIDLIQKDISKVGRDKLKERFAFRAERYSFFLLDEFQDTNMSQWMSLAPILEEALSIGGVLFYVGDPKQTIYRWRGSVHNIFSVAKGAFPSAKELVFSLERNWRSAQDVVKFNNKLFVSIPTVFAQSGVVSEDMKRIFSDAAQLPSRDESGKVEIFEFKQDDDFINLDTEEMVRQKLIDVLSSVGNLGDVGILVRTRREAAMVVSWLLERDIAVVSDESVTLSANPHIKALVALLGFLAFPYQERFLKGFLLSPLWSVVSQKELFYWQNWIASVKGNVLSALKLRYPDLAEAFIVKFLNKAGFVGVHELCSDIIFSMDLFSRLKGSSAFFYEFLDVLWGYERDEAGTLADFVDWWNSLDESSSSPVLGLGGLSGKSVKVMTVHSAKGLEFPVVILPFLEVDMFRSDKRGLTNNIYWRVTDEGIVPYYISNFLKIHPMLNDLMVEEKGLVLWDNLNLLYVAMTRARDRLVLFLQDTKNRRQRKTWSLWIREQALI